MCGFAGCISLANSAPVLDSRRDQELQKLLAHRGPDCGDTVYLSRCMMTHRRLSIIDLSSAGRQPMANENSTLWISFNGEIYNFRELKKQYQLLECGHKFRSETDTEVILHLFEQLGTESINLLNGMFALALWDDNSNKLILARDRFGIKPIFYTWHKGYFWFASELKALINVRGGDLEPCPEALFHYLSLNYIPGNLTAFKDIFELTPGHFLSLSSVDSRFEIQQFYTDSNNIDYSIKEQDAIRSVSSHLTNAVNRQLVSDVPVGAMLSGGIDSSVIVATMRELHQDKQFHTFSLVFEEPDFNESSFAREVANFCKTEHHEILVTPEKVLESLYSSIAHIDEPFGDGSAIPTFLLAKYAKDYVSVLLSGEGGDELFAGYDTHLAFKVRKLFNLLPRFLRSSIIEPLINQLPVSTKKLSFEFKAKRFLYGSKYDIPHAHYLWREVVSDKLKNSLLLNYNRYSPMTPTYELFCELYERCAPRDPLERLLKIDSTYHLRDDLMVKNDRMTMAHSIEARVPFTDLELVNFMATVPVNLKLKGFSKKNLLKKAYKGRLPQSILKKKKVGLELPYSKWFKNKFKSLGEELFNPSYVSQTDIFNPNIVWNIWKEHQSGVNDHGRILWGLLNYLIWYDQYFKYRSFSTYLVPTRNPITHVQ